MSLYAVKLLPGHEADTSQMVDGYIGYANLKQVICYTRGQAIKKARLFGGKIEKYGKEYAMDERAMAFFKLSQFLPDTVQLLGIKKHKPIDTTDLRENINLIFKSPVHITNEIRTELTVLEYLVLHYDTVKFI